MAHIYHFVSLKEVLIRSAAAEGSFAIIFSSLSSRLRHDGTLIGSSSILIMLNDAGGDRLPRAHRYKFRKERRRLEESRISITVGVNDERNL